MLEEEKGIGKIFALESIIVATTKINNYKCKNF